MSSPFQGGRHEELGESEIDSLNIYQQIEA